MLDFTLGLGDDWFNFEHNINDYAQWKVWNFKYWYDGVV